MTEDAIERAVMDWLAVNNKKYTEVRHSIYPIGFVAALIYEIAIRHGTWAAPTAQPFAHFHESVMSEADKTEQAELKRLTDHWMMWKSDCKNFPGRDFKDGFTLAVVETQEQIEAMIPPPPSTEVKADA